MRRQVWVAIFDSSAYASHNTGRVLTNCRRQVLEVSDTLTVLRQMMLTLSN